MSILFGKYQLLERIKTGGMAEIWLAKEQGIEDFERLVVIKKVLPGLSEDKNFIEMFLDEGRLAAKLNHPNIVQIYELDKVDDSYYIAMEYISGVNLEELRRRLKNTKKIPLPFICRIISNVANGLHFAHISKDIYGKPLNIVHRDISPHNVLITYEGNVKIVDFGIAKAETQSNKTKTSKGKEDIILFALDLDKGQELISKTFGTSGSDRANSLIVDKENVYISGYLGDDFTNKDNKVLKNHGSSDIFIGKFNKNGESNWIKIIGARGEDAAIDMFKHNNKLYLTGWFQYGLEGIKPQVLMLQIKPTVFI